MGTNAAVGAWLEAVKVLQHVCMQQPAMLTATGAAYAAWQDVSHRLEGLAVPKAAWKKLVQQHQVPSQLGTAFSTAAQQGWQSFPTLASLGALQMLLGAAFAAGITNSGPSALGSSILQQLQQAGVLPALSSVTTALAAHMEADAAALTGTAAAAAGDAQRLAASDRVHGPFLMIIASAYSLLISLWGHQQQDDMVSWVCDPSGHAAACMRLTTAVLRHASSALPHVAALRQRAPPQAELLLRQQQQSVERGLQMGLYTVEALIAALQRQNGPAQQQQQRSEQAALRELLLGPDTLPCIAALLVCTASGVHRVIQADSQTVAEGAGGSSRRSSSSSGSRSRARADSASGGGSNSSSTGAALSTSPTACQLQLLQGLGLSPEVVGLSFTAWPQQPVTLEDAVDRLRMPVAACWDCVVAAMQLRSVRSVAPGQLSPLQQQQCELRWLWQLLPAAVLLPSASDLLSASTDNATLLLTQIVPVVQQLLSTSRECVSACVHLQPVSGEQVSLQGTFATYGTFAAWLQDSLAVTLRLAEQLLPPQQAVPAATAAAAPAPAAAAAGGGNSSSSSSGPARAQSVLAVFSAFPNQPPQVCVIARLLALLSKVVSDSLRGCYWDGAAEGVAGAAAAAPPGTTVAREFVALGAASEAALRTLAAAAQGSVPAGLREHVAVEIDNSVSFLYMGGASRAVFACAFARHMGLCGPEAFKREQRQLYSCLGTVLKLCRGPAGAESWLGEEVAATCCLAAAHTAVWLLKLLLPPGPEGRQRARGADLWARTAAAAAQQPQTAFLPSLVIFGRCCLFWAQRLQQQARQLLSLAQGPLQQQPTGDSQRQALCHKDSAASTCIPGWRQRTGTAAAGDQGSAPITALLNTIAEWMIADMLAPETGAQLAAAGLTPQQVVQQAEAWVQVEQGAAEALTDASLTALVQQLQAFGTMLSGIAVPHFCNNTACSNINGPSELALVSGRSCICSGCRTARYCGRACQRLAWAQHKPVCKALAAGAGVPVAKS